MNRDEQQLCGLVALHADVDPSSITPHTTLRGDLGLDGHAASHFLEDYEQTFGVDAEEIWKHWTDYFGTSGVTLRDVVVILLAWVLLDGVLLLTMSVEYIWLALPVDAAAIGVWALVRRFVRGASPHKKEIAIGDLYAALESRRVRLRRMMR